MLTRLYKKLENYQPSTSEEVKALESYVTPVRILKKIGRSYTISRLTL